MAKRNWKPIRYRRLKSEGFLPEEARFYAQLPISEEGIRKLRYFRKREIKKALKAGISKTTIPSYIRQSYIAKGLVTKNKEPDVNEYSRWVIAQLEKPRKQRETVFIQPDRFDIFKEAKEAQFTIADSLKLATLIPKEQWDKRKGQYRQLIATRYSPYEAFYIITATSTNKEGKKVLQKLDLTQPVWQTAMEERQNYFIQEVRKGIQKGMTTRTAIQSFKQSIQNWYKDKKHNPFDEIEEVSPSGPRKPQVDIQEARKNRRAKQKAKGMPFLARR